MSTPEGAERPREVSSRTLQTRVLGLLRKGRVTAFGLFRGERLVELVTALALLGGGLLIVADFLDLLRIEAGRLPVEQQSGGDQHSYAMLVIGIALIGATLLARSTGQWPPAGGAVVLAVIALAIALAGDLPEATRSDLVRGARLADADPAIGFWAELLGALLSLAGGAGLAYLLRPGPGDREP
jgi:hypothetical protein